MPITPTTEFNPFLEWLLSMEITQKHILLKLVLYCRVPGSSLVSRNQLHPLRKI